MSNDARILNYKGVITWFVIVEHQAFMGSVHTVLEVYILFNPYKFHRMAHYSGYCSEEIFKDFYDSYLATLRGYLDKRERPVKIGSSHLHTSLGIPGLYM